MITAFFTNFGYFSQESFDTIEAAGEYARSVGFELQFYQNKQLIATYSPISGFKTIEVDDPYAGE